LDPFASCHTKVLRETALVSHLICPSRHKRLRIPLISQFYGYNGDHVSSTLQRMDTSVAFLYEKTKLFSLMEFITWPLISLMIDRVSI
jgi:hypothetical protein